MATEVSHRETQNELAELKCGLNKPTAASSTQTSETQSRAASNQMSTIVSHTASTQTSDSDEDEGSGGGESSEDYTDDGDHVEDSQDTEETANTGDNLTTPRGKSSLKQR